MKTRADFYNDFKKVASKTKHRGLGWPKGSVDFWKQSRREILAQRVHGLSKAKSLRYLSNRSTKTLKEMYKNLSEIPKPPPFRYRLKKKKNQKKYKIVKAPAPEEEVKENKYDPKVLEQQIEDLINNCGELTLEFNNQKEKLDFVKFFFKRLHLNSSKKAVIKMGSNNYLTVNEMNVPLIQKLLLTGEVSDVSSNVDIDNYDLAQLKTFRKFRKVHIKVYDAKKKSKTNKRNAGFFRYTVSEDIYMSEWSRYGLFTSVEASNYNHNCLYRAFLESDLNLPEEDLKALQNSLQTREIPLTKIKDIAESFKVNIKVTQCRTEDSYFKSHNFNKKASRVIKIGLIDKHYFIIDKQTNITKYAIDHFDEINHLERWNTIAQMAKKKNGLTPKRKKNRTIDSCKLICYLLANKKRFLKNITLDTKGIYETQFYETIDQKIDSLEYNKDLHARRCSKTIEYKNYELYEELKKLSIEEPTEELQARVEKIMEKLKPKEKSEIINKVKHDKANNRLVCFDFETDANKTHDPYLVCYTTDTGISKSFNKKGNNYKFIKNFLDELEDGDVCYAHNLGYDFRFIMKYGPKSTIVTNMVVKGKKTFHAAVQYNDKEFTFKDSAAMITMPLKKFGDCFKLKVEKEIMNYNIYNEKNLNKESINISQFTQKLNLEETEQFMKNVKKWGLLRPNNTFDHIAYATKYCMLDCEVLLKGLLTFRKWIKDMCREDLKIPEIDIKNIITISSLAKLIFTLRNSFKGVYDLGGHIRQFIQNSVVGGRCMTRLNKKYHIKQKKTNKKNKNSIQDLDGVSLYPSAIARLKGYLKGRPEVIKKDNLNIDFLKTQDAYFVEIEIKNIPKERPFPLVSKVNKKGVRVFSNSVEELFKDSKDRTITVDDITMGDLMNFHEMKENTDFKIIRGYSFNSGFNKRCVSTIKILFNARLKKKAEKNPIQIIYKLLLNTSYGKLIQKAPSDSTVIKKSREEAETYITRNHNHIKEYTIMNEGSKYERYIIKKVEPINKYFNNAHNGARVLSMSKRIMNEVMNLADDLDINIYYQDTDSMHIEAGVNNKNITKLSEEFKKKYGRELQGKQLGNFHCDFNFKSNDHLPRAIESYILGKKMYMDVVECTNDKETVYHDHTRLKGIPTWAISKPKELFGRLAQGESVPFNLSKLATKLGKALFKFHKDYSISHNDLLSRTIKAEGEIVEVEI